MSQSGPHPDPVVIHVNDVVAWVFKGLRQNDVQLVVTVDQLLDAQTKSPRINPRLDFIISTKICFPMSK